MRKIAHLLSITVILLSISCKKEEDKAGLKFSVVPNPLDCPYAVAVSPDGISVPYCAYKNDSNNCITISSNVKEGYSEPVTEPGWKFYGFSSSPAQTDFYFKVELFASDTDDLTSLQNKIFDFHGGLYHTFFSLPYKGETYYSSNVTDTIVSSANLMIDTVDFYKLDTINTNPGKVYRLKGKASFLARTNAPVKERFFSNVKFEVQMFESN